MWGTYLYIHQAKSLAGLYHPHLKFILQVQIWKWKYILLDLFKNIQVNSSLYHVRLLVYIYSNIPYHTWELYTIYRYASGSLRCTSWTHDRSQCTSEAIDCQEIIMHNVIRITPNLCAIAVLGIVLRFRTKTFKKYVQCMVLNIQICILYWLFVSCEFEWISS